MIEPIPYPWRALENGELTRWLDNGPVWEPGGVPIWPSAEAVTRYRPELVPVPWPIVGVA